MENAIILKSVTARWIMYQTWCQRVWMVVNNLRLSGSLAGSAHNNRGSCGGSDQINPTRDYSEPVFGNFIDRKATWKRLTATFPRPFASEFAPFYLYLPSLFAATAVVGLLLVYFRHSQLLVEYGSAWTSCSQFPKSIDAGDEESPGRAGGRVQDNFGQRVGHVQLGSGDFRTPEYALRGWLF